MPVTCANAAKSSKSTPLASIRPRPEPPNAACASASLDGSLHGRKNTLMKTLESLPIAPELLAELQDAADKAFSGIRDPEIMRQACVRMDLVREEIRKKHGIL